MDFMGRKKNISILMNALLKCLTPLFSALSLLPASSLSLPFGSLPFGSSFSPGSLKARSLFDSSLSLSTASHSSIAPSILLILNATFVHLIVRGGDMFHQLVIIFDFFPRQNPQYIAVFFFRQPKKIRNRISGW